MFLKHLTPPKRLCFHLSLFICQQVYSKSTEPTCTELGGAMGHGPGRTHSILGQTEMIYHKFLFFFFYEVWCMLFDADDGGLQSCEWPSDLVCFCFSLQEVKVGQL